MKKRFLAPILLTALLTVPAFAEGNIEHPKKCDPNTQTCTSGASTAEVEETTLLIDGLIWLVGLTFPG